MSDAPMMKKRGREGHYCDNRHCVSPSDATMAWYAKGQQRAKEQREWLNDLLTELNDATEELVAAVEATAQVRRGDPHELLAELEHNEWLIRDAEIAWTPDPHDTSTDTATITDAADNLNHKLEQS